MKQVQKKHVWGGWPDTMVTSEETTALDIFSKFRTAMLNAMLLATYRRGSKGAPSHPERDIH